MCGLIRQLLLCTSLFHVFCCVFCGVPELKQLPSSVVAVLETESKETTLMQGIRCSDPDGDLTRIYQRSITPSNLCGNCFPIWPCNNDYCLMFVPSLGSLSMGSISSYVIQVACTDDIETEVSVRTVEVRLVANTPPTFSIPANGLDTVDVKPTTSLGMGSLIYDVDADDVDNDPVFYTLSTEPSTDLFEIGYADGKITAAEDLRQLCQDSVVFRVQTWDPFNSPVGPAIIQASLKKRNEAPVITNTERLIEIPENTAASLKVKVDDPNGDDVTYTMWAIPERGLEYYKINSKGTITSRETLDYEYADLRSVTLYVDVTDGFCDAETYSVTMQITDVNEPPVIIPDSVERTVYEGFIGIDPGWILHDPDSPENHVWTAANGGAGKLVVDSGSGFVYSTEDLDIDPGRTQQKYNLKVRVTDKDGERDTGTVRITVLDKNDNPPVFGRQLFEISASECTKAGALLGTINAKDDDSEFQGNNLLVYSGAGVNISVLATGDVTLLNPCTAGQTETIQGFVTDQGLYPGPLSGVPTSITFSCNVCPEPVTVEPTTNTTGNGNATEANDSDFLGLNLGWIVPAILLTLLLISLLTFLVWRYCSRACARWRARRALLKRSPEPRRVQSKAAQPKKEEPSIEMKPVPPEIPPPEAEPFFFGFWKETFPDRDQRHMPSRDVKPFSVQQDQQVEEKERVEEEREKQQRRVERQKVEDQYQKEMDKYQQELNARNNPPPKKKKFCSIL